MTAAWWAAAPAIVGALLLLLGPGLVATAPLRLGIMARLALSGVLAVGSMGVAGVVDGLLDVPYSPWHVLVPALGAAGLAMIARRTLPGLALPRERAPMWALLAMLAGATAVSMVVAFWNVAVPDQISQSYDNLFHLAATAHIMDTGQASSLTLRTLMEPGKPFSFYPAAWHTLVASTANLSGVNVPVAANAAWIAVVGAIWLPGVAWLSQVLLRRFDAGVVALVAIPLGAAFGAMPYALLSWGTLYPTFLATALLPSAVGLPIAVWSTRRTHRRRAWLLLWGGAAVVIVAVAVGFSQPRVMVTWAVMLVPFVVVEVARAALASWRAGGLSRRRLMWVGGVCAGGLVLAALAGFAYAVLGLGLFERPLDDRLGGPQARATQSVWVGFVQVLGQAWPTGSTGVIAFPSILLAAVVLVGIIVAVRFRELRWAVVSYVIFAALFALAAGSDDVVTKLLTASWYKDRYRLSSALPVLGVGFATLGTLVLCRIGRLRALSSRLSLGLPTMAASLVLLASAATLVAGGPASSVEAVFRMPDTKAENEIVSRAQITFLGSLRAEVPDDQLLLGDPWDGSALSLLYGGPTPVFPHVNGQWDDARITVAQRLSDIQTDSSVCDALDELRVRYVVFNPHEFGGGDPIGNQFHAIHAAVKQGLFTPVRTDGESTLYRIDQCGPLPSG